MEIPITNGSSSIKENQWKRQETAGLNKTDCVFRTASRQGFGSQGKTPTATITSVSETNAAPVLALKRREFHKVCHCERGLNTQVP
jgi:hypothetical protein